MHNKTKALNHYKLMFVALAIITVGLVLIIIPLIWPSDGRVSIVLEHLGLVFVPSGLMALVYEVLLRRTFLEEVREQLALSLSSHFHAVDRFGHAGMVDIHESLPDEQINRSLMNATTSIRILQTWIPNMLQLERALEKSAARGCKVQILILDPRSVHAAARNADLGYVDPHTISNGIELNLKQMACFCSDTLQDRIEVRTYDATPVMSLYASDDTRYLGLFWRKRRSSQGPQFEVKGQQSFLAAEVDRHFNDLWASARRVNFSAICPKPAYESIEAICEELVEV